MQGIECGGNGHLHGPDRVVRQHAGELEDGAGDLVSGIAVRHAQDQSGLVEVADVLELHRQHVRTAAGHGQAGRAGDEDQSLDAEAGNGRPLDIVMLDGGHDGVRPALAVARPHVIDELALRISGDRDASLRKAINDQQGHRRIRQGRLVEQLDRSGQKDVLAAGVRELVGLERHQEVGGDVKADFARNSGVRKGHHDASGVTSRAQVGQAQLRLKPLRGGDVAQGRGGADHVA